MIRTGVAFSTLALVAIPSIAQAPFAKDSPVLDDVRATAFRHYMPKEGSNIREKVVCFAADKELSDEFLGRFSLKSVKIVRASECEVGVFGVRLKGTRDFGVLTSIESVTWISGTEAEVRGGNYWSGWGATYSTLRIVYRKGKWVTKSETITGVS
ncbi:MAG TPA: hypothetical protein VI431_00440 [Candidatus Acidoferrum sp.]